MQSRTTVASVTASRASHEDRSAPEWYAGLVFLPAFLANSLAATRRLSRYELSLLLSAGCGASTGSGCFAPVEAPVGFAAVVTVAACRCGDHSAHRVVGGDHGSAASASLRSSKYRRAALGGESLPGTMGTRQRLLHEVLGQLAVAGQQIGRPQQRGTACPEEHMLLRGGGRTL